MKKTLFISSLMVMLALTPGVVYAQNGTGSGAGNGQGSGGAQGDGRGDQLRIQEPMMYQDGTGGQMQNKNQVTTQNKGMEPKLKVNAQNGVGTGNARENMNNVAKAVDSYLTNGNKASGNSQAVSEIAKQQQQAQKQIGKSLTALDNRKGVIETLFGPDYNAVNDMKAVMEQNQLRINQLNDLDVQDDLQAQEMVEALVVQNTTLQEEIQAAESVKSVFGWLVKLFN